MAIADDIEKIKVKLKKEEQTEVNVAMFGQPGAGKSSLINALLGLTSQTGGAQVGVETDKTIDATPYQKDGIILWDLPGYGTKKFQDKKQFSEIFQIDKKDLFLCVTSGKLHESDGYFFNELKQKGKVCIFVVNKSDDIWEDGVDEKTLLKRKEADIKKHVKDDDIKVFFTSCRRRTGLGDLEQEIYKNLDDAKKERWASGAKIYSKDMIEEKKQIAFKKVNYRAGLAAANGINPIPGVNIAVDLGILVEMMLEVRKVFGVDANMISSLVAVGASATTVNLAKNIVMVASIEGVTGSLARHAGKVAIQNVAKYVPLVGSVIAASIGFSLCLYVGRKYVNDCAELANLILDENLKI